MILVALGQRETVTQCVHLRPGLPAEAGGQLKGCHAAPNSKSSTDRRKHARGDDHSA